MLTSGTRPPSGVIAVVHRVDRAARRVGRDGRPQRRIGDAEADFLAFHVAARLHCGGRVHRHRARRSRIAGCFRPIGGRDPGEEQQRHRTPGSPIPAARRRPSAEHVGQRRRRSRRSRPSRSGSSAAWGFRNGWAELALKKPPPLVPSSLMISCDATGPCAIDLLAAFERRRVDVGPIDSAGRLARRAPARRRSTAAAGCRDRSGSDRPRSCRSSSPSAAQSRGSARSTSAMPAAAERKL